MNGDMVNAMANKNYMQGMSLLETMKRDRQRYQDRITELDRAIKLLEEKPELEAVADTIARIKSGY